MDLLNEQMDFDNLISKISFGKEETESRSQESLPINKDNQETTINNQDTIKIKSKYLIDSKQTVNKNELDEKVNQFNFDTPTSVKQSSKWDLQFNGIQIDELNHNDNGQQQNDDEYQIDDDQYEIDDQQIEYESCDVQSSCGEDGRFSRDYEIVRVIGKGNWSTVYQVKHKLDGQTYAIKTQKTRNDNEIVKMAQLNNPHIVRYFSSWKEQDNLYIQLEYCESSLSEIMQHKQLNEQETLQMLQQVLQGLEYLHRKQIVHLDMKPDNILVKDGVYKISDLGMARNSVNYKNEDFQEGDCRYLAQEVLTHQYEQDFDFSKADIFSMGISVYSIIRSCQLPLNGDKWQQLRENAWQIQDDVCSQGLKELVRLMMEKDYGKRPSAKQILDMGLFKTEDEKQLESIQEQNKALISKMEELKQGRKGSI